MTTNRYYFILLAILIFAQIDMFGQNESADYYSPENRLAFAEHLFHEKDYLRAIDEYLISLETNYNDTVQFKSPGGVIFSREGFIFGAIEDTICNKINFVDIKQVRIKKFDIVKTGAIWAVLIAISYFTMDISDMNVFSNCQTD